MATKTFVPQSVKLARRITRYDGKHHAKLAANLSSTQLAQWNAIITACNTYTADTPLDSEEP